MITMKEVKKDGENTGQLRLVERCERKAPLIAERGHGSEFGTKFRMLETYHRAAGAVKADESPWPG